MRELQPVALGVHEPVPVTVEKRSTSSEIRVLWLVNSITQNLRHLYRSAWFSLFPTFACIPAPSLPSSESAEDTGWHPAVGAFIVQAVVEIDPPLSMGAPAGGMYAATGAAVHYSICQGHKPLAISSGFKGLLDDNIYGMNSLGSVLITGRCVVARNLVSK